ncbi:alpha-2,8-polysialyltransferase family protein [Schlegelella sp. S2-27]|uniref:Alpha-2,8-polysialyltransferase family protein n=1 Tax=Caldimonas mangrovi TaxID=2944811 RepID=A0ABT0YLB5_9BURK|nr:alpha-2,8-polysialyltransferase family protein [Caldimonas mangrovi]MCM5679453.1 alpha-2,8-polysialyltransferase family protein [Caldimonas mangrovi]
MSIVAVYFVASPLQYLAAQQIAAHFEPGARQVLIWYKRSLAAIVRPARWDACAYMPWPRWDPLPGWFGRHRRLRQNVRLVAELAGRCDELHLHSAVFDTEAINYFLRALPRACGARTLSARILPDGVISIRRYPLTPAKRLAQHLRKLRRLAAPELDYTTFAGDRIGSDASFCDRIYVLPGLPHEYPAAKAVTLPPLAAVAASPVRGAPRRALVIGQPLTGFGLMDSAGMLSASEEIEQWLRSRNIDQVLYKGHPKDAQRELWRPGYEVLDLDEPLESWLAHEHFDAVAGVRSSALLFAKQIYGADTEVAAFGWDRIRFKSDAEKRDISAVFQACGVALL